MKARTGKRGGWVGGALIASVSLVVSLGLAEVATRLFFPFRNYTPRLYVHEERTWPWCQPLEHSRLIPSPLVPGKSSLFLLPNHDFAHQYPDNPRGYFDERNRIYYHDNNLGLRGPDVTREDAERRDDRVQIALLGDSFSFGEGVRLEDTFGRLLEAGLERRLRPLKVEVVNLAQPGADTADEVTGWLTFGGSLRPDLVLLGFAPNDVPLSERSQEADRNLKGWYLGMFGEPSGLERYLRSVRLAHIALARQIVDTKMRQVTARDLHRSDGDAPSPWDQCASSLTRLREGAILAGARFLIVALPVMDGLDASYPYEAIHDAVRDYGGANGTTVIDLLPTFRGMRGAELWVHAVDHHPNEVAHRMIADAILANPEFEQAIESIRAEKMKAEETRAGEAPPRTVDGSAPPRTSP